jgi:glycosyltransferase involved in cell wall biosynthesis
MPATRRLLVLTRYDRLGASSRVRFLQYLPAIEQGGFICDVRPLLGNNYIRALYEGGRVGPGAIAAGFIERLQNLMRRRRYDLIWLEKEAMPFVPYMIERRLLGGVPYVIDFDDAWFLRYQELRLAPLRWLLGDKIDVLMRDSAAVVVGNDYLAEHARGAGAPRIDIIPSTIDLDRYGATASVPAVQARAPIVIGWIGTPVTVRYLARLEPVFRRLAGDGIVVRIVGAQVPAAWAGLPAESVPWSEADEVAEIAKFDIGLMPIDDGEWERGKCGYKALQVMAMGRPVVASMVGANCSIFRHGHNGFLARTHDDWFSALQLLAGDPVLRGRIGAAARETVEADYSLASQAPRLIGVLDQALSVARATGRTNKGDSR